MDIRRLVWVDDNRHRLSQAAGGELRNARRKLGLSQRGAARTTGVSQGNICKLDYASERRDRRDAHPRAQDGAGRGPAAC